MVKALALIVGVAFIGAGLFGFVPALSPQHSDGMRYLLGLFMVGGVHNLIHILSGVAAIIGGLKSEKYARIYFLVFGTVYGLVTVDGFIQKTTVLGLFDINKADNFLHLFLAVMILGIGLVFSSRLTVKQQTT